MIRKCVSLLASFLMLFSPLFPAEPAKQDGKGYLVEEQPKDTATRVYDKCTGIGDTVFYIGRPAGDLAPVNGSDFGMSAAEPDNYPAFCRALDYCRTHPGTKLCLSPGSYRLHNTDALPLYQFRDICIDGNGAEFVFANVRNAFEISQCDGVEIRNISFDWDWDNLRLSDIVRVENVRKKEHTLDLVFTEIDNVQADTVLSALTLCDPESLTYGGMCKDKECYIYQQPERILSVEKIGDTVLRIKHDGMLSAFDNKDMCILRHYVYDTAFSALSGESRNITWNGVSLYGYPGSGFYVGGKASHFQFLNCYIGVKPNAPQSRHTSLGSDAIHIVNSCGCFRVQGCDISGMGDDAVNVHDALGIVTAVSGNAITLTANAMPVRVGDKLAFRDAAFNETDVTAVVRDCTFNGSDTYQITLTAQEGTLCEGYIAQNLSGNSGNYVIADNYFHENRARALLLQSPNGLCENNRFFKTEMQAIKIIMDVSPGLWYEGTGVDQLLVRGNTFEQCDYIGTGEVITIGTNLAGKPAASRPFTNIEISGNTFRDFPKRVLNANNVNGLVFSGNTISPGTRFPYYATHGKTWFGAYSANITMNENRWEGCLLGEIPQAENFSLWVRLNRGA